MAAILMQILRKGKELLEISKCKLGIPKWVHEFWYEYRVKPRKAIFSKKGGRKRAQYYTKNCSRIYCERCGKKRKNRYENKKDSYHKR